MDTNKLLTLEDLYISKRTTLNTREEYEYECSSFCSSGDMSLFFWEFQFEVPNPVVGCCEYSHKLQILGANATAPFLLVSEIWRVCHFKNFQRTWIKKITKLYGFSNFELKKLE